MSNPQKLGNGSHIKLPVKAGVPQVIEFEVQMKKPPRGQWQFQGQTFDVPADMRATYQIDDGPVSLLKPANFCVTTEKPIKGGKHTFTVTPNQDCESMGFNISVGLSA